MKNLGEECSGTDAPCATVQTFFLIFWSDYSLSILTMKSLMLLLTLLRPYDKACRLPEILVFQRSPLHLGVAGETQR